jgi:hypothetical protein
MNVNTPHHNKQTNKAPWYYSIYICANLNFHHARLLPTAAVGTASLRPRFTVTLLCRSTVLMSNGVLSVTAVGAGGLFAATWLCAATLVDEVLGVADEIGEAALAEPELLAIMLTAWPAGVVVDAARISLVVSVAELTDDVLDDEVEAAACAPGGAEPPATTVTADATVCIVLAGAPMEPSWNEGAAGASMGNDPAGHMHRQLQPPF